MIILFVKYRVFYEIWNYFFDSQMNDYHNSDFASLTNHLSQWH